MRILIWADASPSIGGGHVMRCLTLAEELRRRGHDCAFMSGGESTAVVPDLARHFPRLLLPCQTPKELDAYLQSSGTQVVVFDHYGLDASFELAARDHACVIVLDDLPGRRHHCDLLIDPTFGRRASDYESSVQDFALGPAFALLRVEFVDVRRTALSIDRPKIAQRLFVCFGMTDFGQNTLPAVKLILERFPDLEIDVAVGANVPAIEALCKLAGARQRLNLHIDPDGLAHLMARADICLGAAGTMSWERCCLALPSVAIPLVDNQLEIAAGIQRTGSAIAIMPAPSEALARAADALAELLTDHARRMQMSACAAAICDGRGVRRISNLVEKKSGATSELPAPQVSLREANQTDCEAIWCWRNDYLTRAMSVTTTPVLWSDHQLWFSRSLSDQNRIILIAMSQEFGESVGMVRFDRRSERCAAVSINIAPHARGRGIGVKALIGGCARAFVVWDIDAIVADVAHTNSASIRLFESSGFSRAHGDGAFALYEIIRETAAG